MTSTPSPTVRVAYAIVPSSETIPGKRPALRITIVYQSGRVRRSRERFGTRKAAEEFLARFYPELVGRRLESDHIHIIPAYSRLRLIFSADVREYLLQVRRQALPFLAVHRNVEKVLVAEFFVQAQKAIPDAPSSMSKSSRELVLEFQKEFLGYYLDSPLELFELKGKCTIKHAKELGREGLNKTAHAQSFLKRTF